MLGHDGPKLNQPTRNHQERFEECEWLLISNEDPDHGHGGIELGVIYGEFEVLITSSAGIGTGWSSSGIKVKTKAPEGFPQPHWQHLFATYDGSGKASGVRLYLNGLRQPLTIQNDTQKGVTESDVPLHIGGRSPGEFRYTGSIDDVRIYNRQLTDQEIQYLVISGLQELPSNERSPDQQKWMSAIYRTQDQQLQRLQGQLEKAQAALREYYLKE